MAQNRTASEKTTCFLLWLGAAFIFFSLGTKLWNVDVLDETGTMSVAAFLAGDDWSLTNLGMGSFYYKYFQSLFYVPFFLLIRHPFTRYKAIMAFHALVMAVIPVCVYHISRKFLRLDKRMALLFTGAVSSVPAVILYCFYARADLFLEVLPWILLVLLLEGGLALENGQKLKGAIISVLAAGTAVAGYASHTRGLIMVIASLMTLILVRLLTGKRLAAWLPYLLSTVVFMAADRAATRYFKANVWPYGIRHANMKSINWPALKLIFTKDGFAALLKMCTGWYYNATAATFGLALLAVAVGVILFFRAIKTHPSTFRQETEIVFGIEGAECTKSSLDVSELTIALFGVLEFLGSAAMGILFFYPKASRLFFGTASNRGDRLVYGRYMAAAYGLVVLLGLYALLIKKTWLTRKTKICLFAAHLLLFGFFALKTAPVTGTATLSIRNLVSLCRFLPMSGFGYINGHFHRMPTALICMGLYASAGFAVILYLSGKERRRTAVIALALLILLNTENLCSSFLKLRYNTDMGLSQTTVPLYTAVRGFSGLDPSLKNVYIDDGISLKSAQVVMADFRCVNDKAWKKWRKTEGKKDMLYILPLEEEAVLKKLAKKDWHYVDEFETGSGAFGIYAAGEELCGQLQDLGYELKAKTVSAGEQQEPVPERKESS